VPSGSLSFLLSIAVLATGCVDERIVYENVRFPPLPDGASSFVGYSDNAAKQTVCGNCHVGQHADWETSAHSGAWQTLAASGGGCLPRESPWRLRRAPCVEAQRVRLHDVSSEESDRVG
jgi:hypothetical protein